MPPLPRTLHGLIPAQGFRRNVTTTLGAGVLGLVISVGASAVLARMLGADGKGELALTMLLPAIVRLLFGFGVSTANVYYAGSQKVPLANLMSNSVLMGSISTVLASGACYCLIATGFVARLVPGVKAEYLLVALTSVPITLLMINLNGLLQGMQRIEWLNLVSLVRRLFHLVAILALIAALRMGVLGGIIASLLSTALGLGLVIWNLRDNIRALAPEWRWPIMRKTLSFGLRSQAGSVFQFLAYRVDLFIVNYFLGPREVGIYSVAVTLTELLWQLPNAVGFVIFPRAASSPPEAMNRFTPRVFRMTSALLLLGAAVLALSGRPLIGLVYPDAFLAAYAPMLVLLPGTIMLGAAKVLTNDLAGRGMPHLNSTNSLISSIAAVVLNLLLIPRLRLLGPAVASTIVYAITFVISALCYSIVSHSSVLLLFRASRDDLAWASQALRAVLPQRHG